MDQDTVWKFHDFSIPQILREINLWDSRSAKSAYLTDFDALNGDLCEVLHFLKAEINQINKIQSPQNDKNCCFRSYKLSKIDFT